jgi:hypothetical protein
MEKKNGLHLILAGRIALRGIRGNTRQAKQHRLREHGEAEIPATNSSRWHLGFVLRRGQSAFAPAVQGSCSTIKTAK